MTIFSLVALSYNIYAQSIDDIGKIALSVIMPENVETLNASQISKLESKVTQICTKAGLSASGYDQTFVIYPKFDIYETNVVEGGMQNITVIKCELSLYIKQVSNNVLFSSVVRDLKGSGKTKELAITNAISQIPISDKGLLDFIAEGKNKIIGYYEANCNDIIKKAESYNQSKKYEDAIATILQIPEEITSCYDQVLDKVSKYYTDYQKQICSNLILASEAKLATKDYVGALDHLCDMDPKANCYSEAVKIIKRIENQIADAERRAWELRVQKYNDAKAREERNWNFKMQQYSDDKAREQRNFKAEQWQKKEDNEFRRQYLDAAKEVAIQQAKNQPKKVTYNYIIR